MATDEWWAEPFDLQTLKAAGFTYREARELELLREQAIPQDVKDEVRETMQRAFGKLDLLLDALRDDTVKPEEED